MDGACITCPCYLQEYLNCHWHVGLTGPKICFLSLSQRWKAHIDLDIFQWSVRDGNLWYAMTELIPREPRGMFLSFWLMYKFVSESILSMMSVSKYWKKKSVGVWQSENFSMTGHTWRDPGQSQNSNFCKRGFVGAVVTVLVYHLWGHRFNSQGECSQCDLNSVGCLPTILKLLQGYIVLIDPFQVKHSLKFRKCFITHQWENWIMA